MRVVSTNVYVGPNRYALFPVVRHVIDLGHLEQWPTSKLGPTFVDGLLRRLPGLQEHGCSYGEPGGFVRRLTEGDGTWLGHVWEHVALELQVITGADVTFGKTRGTGTPGEYDLVYAYDHREVGLEAGELGRRLLLDLLPPEARDTGQEPAPFDWDAERDEWIRFAQRRQLGPSTASLVDAAKARDIPWLRLNSHSLIQFGHGRYQQRIQATITSQTTHIAVEISSDKEETHDLLRDLGLPVPAQRVVQSPRGAVQAAERLGYPVVLKPLNANHGRGVSIDLSTPEEVETAFDVAVEAGRGNSVLVETYVRGFDHRMLVVGGTLVAVAKRVPGHVVGDGEHTIEELVDIVNEDPRRGVGHEKVLTRLAFDHQAQRLLGIKGYDRSTVLPPGEIVYLRDTANLSTGGTATDMTDVVHPDNRFMAERAVQAVGLDVGGVDFLTTDVTQSWKDVGGAIVEINAAPGFRMHVAPSEGQPRDVAGPVIDMLFPPGTPTRIPIAAITGTNGKTTTSRMVAHILKGSGHTVGMTSTDGVYIDGQLTVKGDMTGPTAARMVLRDPMVDVAVMETARGGLLRAGMGYRRCDVGAVLNVDADHLGVKGIDTLDQLAEIKRIVVETAQDTAVLNADDVRCLSMADHTRAEHICYVTMKPEHELVLEHIRSGGRAVVLEKGMNGDMITIYDKGAHIPLVWTHLIPATMEGRARHNVQNAMFAAAIAFSLGKGLEDIRSGLRTFDTSFFQAPGRMNLFHEHPFRVLLDYGHNPAAIRSVVDTVSSMDVEGRRTVVLTAPGDRRDEDVTEIARIAAGNFDRYVLKADDDRRGRRHEEVPELQRATLLAQGVADDAITIIPWEKEAVAHALATAESGDFVLIFGDDITRCWKQIVHFSPNGEESPDTTATTTAPATTAGSARDGDGADEEVGQAIQTGRLIRDERGVRLARESDD